MNNHLNSIHNILKYLYNIISRKNNPINNMKFKKYDVIPKAKT